MAEKSSVFETEIVGNVIVVVPTDDHVGFRMSEIQAETKPIVETLSSGKARHVLIDGAKTSYLSSSVISAGIEMWDAAMKQNGRLAVCNLSDDAMEALVATRLDTKWPSFESRDEALKTLQ